jgi:tetratricopeptide (TPR) repeat protein
MFWAYNLRMRSSFVGRGSLLLLLFISASFSFSQSSARSSPPSASDAEKGLALAESGHCAQGLPLLKRAIRSTTGDRDVRKRVGLTGLHCAMTRNEQLESLPFLEVLLRDFSNDPEVLYTATHAFSDMSLVTSQTLAREAPFSYQVHLLNAEALELQGKWDEAAAEYRRIIDINPMLQGIHARLGRALLAKPQPTPDAVAQAKRNFEQELEINPRDASSEYVLGELARTDNDFSTAARHYTRATTLDTGFAEAYLGLGMSLVSAKRFAEAIPPLEQYEKLAPESPTGHYQLALAYSGAGRRDDANREAALQRDSAASLEKVKRRVAEGLEQQGAPSGSDQPK